MESITGEKKIEMNLANLVSEMSFAMLPSILTVNPYNPDDLVTKKGLYIYDKMKDDDTIKIGLLVKKTIMLAGTFDIEPASSSDKDKEICDFVKYCLFERLNMPFSKVLEQMLTAMDYGYSVTEKVFDYITGNPLYNGKMGIKKLLTRPPHGIDFKTDEWGNILYLRQYQYSSYSKDLPVDKFIIHSYQKEFDNSYGTSDLRAVYRPWWCKDIVLKFLAIHLERYGMPLLIAYYTGVLTADEKTDVGNLLKYLQTGSGFRLPEGKIRIDKHEFPAPAGYDSALDRYDKMMTRGLLMPDQLGFNNTQLIVPLVKLNYAGVNKFPKFKQIPIQQDDLEKLAGIYATMTSSGYISPQNKKDLKYIRTKFDLPVDEEPQQPTKLNFAMDKNETQKDFINAEKELEKLIHDNLNALSLKDYEDLFNAFQNKDFEKMKEIINKNALGEIDALLENMFNKRYYMGASGNY
jgi:phage gp29-like protein